MINATRYILAGFGRNCKGRRITVPGNKFQPSLPDGSTLKDIQWIPELHELVGQVAA
jgi:hypothetical protein